MDSDGTMQGYDMDLISKFPDKIQVPLTALGGIGSSEDIASLWVKWFGWGCSGQLLYSKENAEPYL